MVRDRGRGYNDEKHSGSETIRHRSKLRGELGAKDVESVTEVEEEDTALISSIPDPIDVLTNKGKLWMWYTIIGSIFFGFIIEDPWRPIWHQHRPPPSHGVPHIMLYMGYLWMAVAMLLVARYA
jgi:hypothetical protein